MIKAVGLIGTGALVAGTLVGCHSGSSTSPTATSTTSVPPTSAVAAPTTSAVPADYINLLIKETDIVAPEAFTAKPPIPNPGGQPGVATSFSNADGSHVIGDTILVFADEATANTALEAAKAALGQSVNGTPQPADIGTGGTMASGASPDGSKSVTVVLFTEGKTFTTLEFDGPVAAEAPEDFVTDVGQKQDAAIKAGLPG